MFIKFWIIWAVAGLSVATWLFIWSLKTRQFENSRKASLLPFDDIDMAKTESNTGKGRGILITVVSMLAISIATSLVVLYFVLI